jgi:hypothetical protein
MYDEQTKEKIDELEKQLLYWMMRATVLMKKNAWLEAHYETNAEYARRVWKTFAPCALLDGPQD